MGLEGAGCVIVLACSVIAALIRGIASAVERRKAAAEGRRARTEQRKAEVEERKARVDQQESEAREWRTILQQCTQKVAHIDLGRYEEDVRDLESLHASAWEQARAVLGAERAEQTKACPKCGARMGAVGPRRVLVCSNYPWCPVFGEHNRPLDAEAWNDFA